MFKVKVEPEACKKEGTNIKGHVVMRVPSFDEKYRYIEECGFEVDEDGQMKMSMKQMGAIRKMVSFSKDHYEEIKLVKRDGKKVESFEQMQYDPDCDEILIEVASQLMNGFKVGKN